MPTFEWDEDNLDHLAQHRITPFEVQEVFDGHIMRKRGRTDRTDRVQILGRTAGGRYLLIIVEEKANDVIRPFTGWEMAPHERQLYGRQIKD